MLDAAHQLKPSCTWPHRIVRSPGNIMNRQDVSAHDMHGKYRDNVLQVPYETVRVRTLAQLLAGVRR